MIIKVENLNRIAEKHKILSDISFDVEKNTTLTILGKSGSGKSSLLRTVCGLEKSYTGKIFICEREIKSDIVGLQKIGMVFQHSYLFPHFNVMDNLTYAMRFTGIKNEAIIARASQLLAKFNLIEKAKAMPSKLSGGQKQRVAICRAMMLQPEILLLDEPTSALDPYSIKGLVNLILELKTEITIIVVTHHIAFAKAIADRVIFMHEGKILSNQAKDDFFNSPDSFAAKVFLDNML
ncbi:MAG: ATP-binding cassette domain-containing protein [Rickettsiaceae bacterium]|nr:ATP-binding cassette domain-containing protein [Rickettsiaceae bacterium]